MIYIKHVYRFCELVMSNCIALSAFEEKALYSSVEDHLI